MPTPVLRRRLQHLVGVDPHEVGDFVPALLDLRPGQIDLVQHRNHLEVGLEGQKKVGERLGLHPLAGVDDQDRPLAGGQRTRDFVAEVDVSGGVDQVEGVRAPIGGGVLHPHSVELDRDPALPLQLVGVEHLVAHLAAVERPGGFEQPVGQRRLAVVDVGDDAEVADEIGRQGVDSATRGIGMVRNYRRTQVTTATRPCQITQGGNRRRRPPSTRLSRPSSDPAPSPP